jgi:hypothetical protein
MEDRYDISVDIGDGMYDEGLARTKKNKLGNIRFLGKGGPS